MKVAVCICTYRRRPELKRLLESLEHLDFEGDLHVVVVDNDIGAEGHFACEQMKSTYRWPLHHQVEPERGISQARNRAVRMALSLDPKFIAMLDDDEWVQSQWLYELLRVQKDYRGDVVGGPVRPVLVEEPASWINRSGFFNRREYLDGTLVRPHGTGNVLVRTSCIRSLGPQPFDPSFGLTGGEDTVFFLTLERLGYRLVWAAAAVVMEEIPSGRMTELSMLQRCYWSGNSRIRAFRFVWPGASFEFARLVRTAAIFCVAVCIMIFGFWDKALRFRGRCLYERARGRMVAHLGRKHEEHRSIYGSII